MKTADYAQILQRIFCAGISALHTSRKITAKKAPANLRYYDSGPEAQIYQRIYSAGYAPPYRRSYSANKWGNES